jgi:ubiquitin-like-conjugating enzyme ATG3
VHLFTVTIIMSDLIQAVKGTALSVAEYFTPVLKQSKFKQTGVLTPEEFVIAGDHLVHQCPTWSWSSASDPSLRKPYLPADKQYLITKSVPCYKRCKDIEYCDNDEKVIMTENDDEGWVDTHHSEQAATINEMVDDLNLNDQPGQAAMDASRANQASPTGATCPDEGSHNVDDDDEAEDMDKFMNMIEENDTSVAPIKSATVTELEKVSPDGPDKDNRDLNRENIVATRTYDLNITYDKYYQTPRLWLVGYDENLKPLSINDMYQDISQDHAKKTVTMENHPHIPAVMASVHPCRHAEVMKKIISTVEEGGKELQVHSYLIIFLKLVQSVIPTLEYDFTQNFTM